MAKRKTISHAAITGDKGIALIHRTVLDMDFVWNATHLEAGIDGYIELRDPKTGEVTNCIVQVQSKAGPSWFKAETDDTFEFTCDERDLNHWLSGNAPVVLVVSRPDDGEAYWISINDYFREPHRRKDRKILFSKRKDRFDAGCRERLAALAIPADSGIHIPALPRDEILVCNLIPLQDYPKRLFRASTKLRFPHQVWHMLYDHSASPPWEWLLHGTFLYSFHDLTFEPWTSVCLSQTTDNLSTVTWAVSDDPQKQYVFLRMLLICLQQLLRRQGVRYSKNKEHFFFQATDDLSEKHVGGLSVFKAYPSKTNPSRTAYFRHRAMKAQFVRFAHKWYLEVTPSYHFTQDGIKLSRYYEERLRGIKMLERQNKVHLRQLRLWTEVLQQTHLAPLAPPPMRQLSLFEHADDSSPPTIVEPYPYIRFGPLLEFQVGDGVPESAWLPSEPEVEDDPAQRRLF